MPLIIPVFFGVENFIYAVASSVAAIVAISVVLAFVSGISMQRRIVLNIALVTARGARGDGYRQHRIVCRRVGGSQ